MQAFEQKQLFFLKAFQAFLLNSCYRKNSMSIPFDAACCCLPTPFSQTDTVPYLADFACAGAAGRDTIILYLWARPKENVKVVIQFCLLSSMQNKKSFT